MIFLPTKPCMFHFRRWRERGIWEALSQELVRAARRRAGRDPEPSVAIIDSQSVKSAGSGEERGFHGGKLIKGRSRHVATDTAGRLLSVRVTSARKGDSSEAGATLAQARERWVELETVVADQGYQAQAKAEASRLGLSLQVVKKRGSKRFPSPPMALGH